MAAVTSCEKAPMVWRNNEMGTILNHNMLKLCADVLMAIFVSENNEMSTILNHINILNLCETAILVRQNNETGTISNSL